MLKLQKKKVRLQNYGTLATSGNILNQMRDVVDFSKLADNYFNLNYNESKQQLHQDSDLIERTKLIVKDQRKSNKAIFITDMVQTIQISDQQQDIVEKQSRSQERLDEEYKSVLDMCTQEEKQQMIVLKFQNNMQLIKNNQKKNKSLCLLSGSRTHQFHRSFSHLVKKMKTGSLVKEQDSSIIIKNDTSEIKSVIQTEPANPIYLSLINKYLLRNKLVPQLPIRSQMESLKISRNQPDLRQRCLSQNSIRARTSQKTTHEDTTVDVEHKCLTQREYALSKLKNIQLLAKSRANSEEQKSQSEKCSIYFTADQASTQDTLQLLYKNFGYERQFQKHQSFVQKQINLQKKYQKVTQSLHSVSPQPKMNQLQYDAIKKNIKILKLKERGYMKKLGQFQKNQLLEMIK